MKHSSSGHGENIFAIWPVEIDPGKKELGIIAVDEWYGEVRYYDFNGPEENTDFEKIGNIFYHSRDYFNILTIVSYHL